MRKKRVVLLGCLLTCSMLVGLFVSRTASKASSAPIAGEGDDYVLNLNQDNVPAAIEANYQDNVVGTFKSSIGNDLVLNFVNAKQLEEGFVELAPRGMIYNFHAGDSALTGLKAVKYNGSGSLAVKVATAGQAGGAVLGEAIELNAGEKQELLNANYFELVAGDGGAKIESLELYYSCDAGGYDISAYDGRYTGVSAGGTVYQLDVENGNVEIASLNRKDNFAMSGIATLESETDITCEYIYASYKITYKLKASADKQALTFVSKSDEVGGMVADEVEEVNFNRVYNVEDFESYDKTGQGYTNATTKYQTSGLRANYYADYYTGSSSGPIGGSGWPIMTSTDNSNLTMTGGRDGSQAGVFKFSNGMGMRYIQMNELYGVPQVIGKGAKLSFWARTPYTNLNYNADCTQDINIKFYGFFSNQLTPSNQTLVRTTGDFVVKAGGEWQHFEVNLDASKYYFGFGLFAQQKSGSTVYLPIDDVEIYTESPYAEYVPNPEDLYTIRVDASLVAGWDPAPDKFSLHVWGENDALYTFGDEEERMVAEGESVYSYSFEYDGEVHGVKLYFYQGEADKQTVDLVTTFEKGETYNITLIDSWQQIGDVWYMNAEIHEEGYEPTPTVEPTVIPTEEPIDEEKAYKFIVDVTLIAGWNPAPADYSIHAWGDAGDCYAFDNAKERMAATEEANVYELMFEYEGELQGAIFYFYQGAEVKQTVNLELAYEKGCTYIVTLEEGSWVEVEPGKWCMPASVAEQEIPVVYPAHTYFATVTAAGNDVQIVIASGEKGDLNVTANNVLIAGAAYQSMNMKTGEFVIATEDANYGNISGVYDFASDKMTSVSCSGNYAPYITNNGNLEFNVPETFWNCDGTTEELQTTFKRRYMSGSWQVDNSNADRIARNEEQAISGTSAKRRGYGGGAVALNFQNDFATAVTVKNVSFWVYNPSESDITLRMWGYKAKGFGSNFETGSVVAKAGQWTYCKMGFTEASIYNFQIANWVGTGTYLSFDNITLY